MNKTRRRSAILSFAAAGFFTIAAAAPVAAPDDPSLNDIPKSLKMPVIDRDYTKRTEMIAMRDGVKLYTIILIPKGAKNAPILLTHYIADGAVFGIAVFIVMNLVVIPLSAMPPRPFVLTLTIRQLLVHIVCVGLPISIAAHLFAA